ncbi:MAG TPA: zf-HC2 domain-containing protein [Terriglobales bacterium]|nr:zf-HC2 domain-containing protein [Terriglobales bacterium]
MNCEWRGRLEAYADGEIRQPELERLQAHLRTCSSCAAEALGHMQMKRAVHTAATDAFVPSVELRTKLLAAIDSRRASRRAWWPKLAFASTMVTALLVAALILLRPTTRPDVFAEVIDLHTSALASANPVDVVSSDRHTVKPWFQGKLPFTFNLPELQNSEFQLIGGRMAYIEHSPAAQLLFGVRKHEISVFILQDSDKLDKELGKDLTTRRLEFNLKTWPQAGLRYIAISDSNAADVEKLSSLLHAAQ